MLELEEKERMSMKIEISDQDAKTMLAGLRSDDPAVLARLADLLEEQVRSREQFPFDCQFALSPHTM
jgi:hypothetical protein